MLYVVSAWVNAMTFSEDIFVTSHHYLHIVIICLSWIFPTLLDSISEKTNGKCKEVTNDVKKFPEITFLKQP